MEYILYFIFGFIVSIIHWFFIMTNVEKSNFNICIALPLTFFLWPGIVIGWVYRASSYINESYITNGK